MGTVPKNTKMCKTEPSPKTQKRVKQNRPQKHKNERKDDGYGTKREHEEATCNRQKTMVVCQEHLPYNGIGDAAVDHSAHCGRAG